MADLDAAVAGSLAVRLDSDGRRAARRPAVRAVSRGPTSTSCTCSCRPAGPRPRRCCPASTTSLVCRRAVDRDAVDAADQVRRRRRARRAPRATAVRARTTRRSSSRRTTRARCRWRCCCGWPACRRSSATSDDYPGSLLDVRHRRDRRRRPGVRRVPRGGGHAAPSRLPPATPAPGRRPARGAHRCRRADLAGSAPYVVVHPSASVPARGIPVDRAAAASPRRWQRTAGASSSPAARATATLGRAVTPRPAGSTSPAGPPAPSWPACSPEPPQSSWATPARRTSRRPSAPRWSSLFAPVVPAGAVAALAACPRCCSATSGAACRVSRARTCPVPGHPCLDVPSDEVVAAVGSLVGDPPVRRVAEPLAGRGRREGARLARARLVDLTSFVQGPHEYLLPVRARPRTGRPRPGPHLGLAGSVPRGHPPRRCARRRSTSCVLQRPHEVDLVERWTGRRVGRRPARGLRRAQRPDAARRAQPAPVAADDRLHGVPVAHVTAFNAMAWDCGDRPDDGGRARHPRPRPRYTGERRLARGRASTSRCAAGGWPAATSCSTWPAGRPCRRLRDGERRARAVAEQRACPAWTAAAATTCRRPSCTTRMARHRAYLHPYRWTSLGLVADRGDVLGHAGARARRPPRRPRRCRRRRARHQRPRRLRADRAAPAARPRRGRGPRPGRADRTRSSASASPGSSPTGTASSRRWHR